MCGILGIVNHNKSNNYEWHKSAIDSIQHRGPDNYGSWVDNEKEVYFYHQRLKIIDLSENANQPMLGSNEDFVLIFNGEIYNFLSLRKKLIMKGHKFLSESDTEVVLSSYIEWGIDCLDYFEGMFSFAIYDKRRSRIFIARDISGEKPLYYFKDNNNFIFASELKPLLKYPSLHKKLNYNALDGFLSSGYFYDDQTIIQDISKLKPAHYLIYDLSSKDLYSKKYWSIPKYKNSSLTSSRQELVTSLDKLIDESIKNQIVADVPVGVLLSGGLDSSIVAAKASKYVNKINTYNVKFIQDKEYDESSYAKKISDYFDTEHHELDSGLISTDILDSLIEKLDEPIADSSIIPTYLICNLVSKDCKVLLGGDGADELFGGYHHYSRYIAMQKILLPKVIKKIIYSFSKELIPMGFYGTNIRTWLMSLHNDFNKSLPNTLPFFDDKNKKLILSNNLIDFKIEEKIYNKINIIAEDIIQSATRSDFKNYLCNDILVKTDRASMLNSIELRAPFLNKNIIEFAFKNVPSDYKANIREKKILLKDVAKKILPLDFNFNRKQGFSLPLGQLFRENKWKKYIEDNIFSNQSKLFNESYLKRLTNNHYKGYNNSERIFLILVLKRWMEKNQIIA